MMPHSAAVARLASVVIALTACSGSPSRARRDAGRAAPRASHPNGPGLTRAEARILRAPLRVVHPLPVEWPGGGSVFLAEGQELVSAIAQCDVDDRGARCSELVPLPPPAVSHATVVAARDPRSLALAVVRGESGPHQVVEALEPSTVLAEHGAYLFRRADRSVLRVALDPATRPEAVELWQDGARVWRRPLIDQLRASVDLAIDEGVLALVLPARGSTPPEVALLSIGSQGAPSTLAYAPHLREITHHCRTPDSLVLVDASRLASGGGAVRVAYARGGRLLGVASVDVGRMTVRANVRCLADGVSILWTRTANGAGPSQVIRARCPVPTCSTSEPPSCTPRDCVIESALTPLVVTQAADLGDALVLVEQSSRSRLGPRRSRLVVAPIADIGRAPPVPLSRAADGDASSSDWASELTTSVLVAAASTALFIGQTDLREIYGAAITRSGEVRRVGVPRP